MLNPLGMMEELRDMNQQLSARLDKIIELLEILIETEQTDYYGDGR